MANLLYVSNSKCKRIVGAGRPTATGTAACSAPTGSTFFNTLTNIMYIMPPTTNTGWILLT